MRLIPHDGTQAIGDFRRYPGCRLLIACSACSRSKACDPERVIDRRRALKTGGHTTRVADVASKVQWTCPACGRLRWRAQFAWPPELGPRDIRRLADRYRN